MSSTSFPLPACSHIPSSLADCLHSTTVPLSLLISHLFLILSQPPTYCHNPSLPIFHLPYHSSVYSHEPAPSLRSTAVVQSQHQWPGGWGLARKTILCPRLTCPFLSLFLLCPGRVDVSVLCISCGASVKNVKPEFAQWAQLVIWLLLLPHLHSLPLPTQWAPLLVFGIVVHAACIYSYTANATWCSVFVYITCSGVHCALRWPYSVTFNISLPSQYSPSYMVTWSAKGRKCCPRRRKRRSNVRC